MSSNNSGTFFYSPDIKIYINSTVLGTTVDVSQDIIDFQVGRSVNAVSMAHFTLANPGFKYTPDRVDDTTKEGFVHINTMDKVIIYMKRVQYLQVFSGYITQTPILTLIPQPVQFQASCTLYTIQNTYWDPNIPEMQQKIPGMLMTQGLGNLPATSFSDGGAGQGIKNLLTDIANWNSSSIHIGAIPKDWINEAVADQSVYGTQDYKSGGVDGPKDRLMRALDGGGLVAGENLVKNGHSVWNGNFVVGASPETGLTGTTLVAKNSANFSAMQAATAIPNGSSLNATLAPEGIGYKKTFGSDGLQGIEVLAPKKRRVANHYADKWENSPDPDDLNPVTLSNMDDDWWCVLPWNYSGSGVAELAKQWLADAPNKFTGSGRQIILTSVNNASQVVVKASMTGHTNAKIVVSDKAFKALAGTPVDTQDVQGNSITFYSNFDVQVVASWADPSIGLKKGVQDTTRLRNTLDQFGVPQGPTTAQKTSTLSIDLQMIVQDWINLALKSANITNNRTHILLMDEWIKKETERIQNLGNPNYQWDSTCNPLGMTWMADSVGNGKYSYPNLYVAALMFALSINPPSDSRNGQGSDAKAFKTKHNLECQYPLIRAAFTSDTDYIRYLYKDANTSKNPLKYLPNGKVVTFGSYSTRYYYSMWLGLTMSSMGGNPTQDIRNELGNNPTGTSPIYYQGIFNNQLYTSVGPGGYYFLQREILSQAILGGMSGNVWQGHTLPQYGLDKGDVRGLFTKKNDRTEYKGSGVKFDKKTNKYDLTNIDESVDYQNYFDNGKLPLRGYTESQGSQVSSSENATRNALINDFVNYLQNDDIPVVLTMPRANAGATDSAGSTAFNIAFGEPQLDPTAMALFGTPRGFITDEPLLPTIKNLATSTLRDFQSAPNGDFVCWFPDYFGKYGATTVLDVYDIEIIDFTVYHDDAPLVTHLAVAGDPYTLGASTDLPQWMDSNGIISVQMDRIMQQLFGADYYKIKGQLGAGGSTFLNRYGLRPRAESVPLIRSHVTEFMYAWRTFMMAWAAQYSTSVSFTFLPELYPGMRVRLADHNIEFYVQAVSHQGSRSSGFSTTAQITCPIRRNKDGKTSMLHYGFPYKS